ncbi:MAG TPA: prolyl oligopeptidase family serine peptidase [Candidatus Acidoferrales bacterium]|nr:prolyl oligopeptidase family serine peptidase [Candidatus Acidoferrales bacterium]
MKAMRSLFLATACIALGANTSRAADDQKPPLTLDAFFNTVSYGTVQISLDGNAVAFTTERPDWNANRFRSDIWLYRASDGSLVQLTQSGKDFEPKWSPNGRWIAFLSGRTEGATATAADADADPEKDKSVQQVYVIAAGGGEAFPVTVGADEVHDFDWSADSKKIYFATREPWSKDKEDAYKKEWNDVIRYREQERSGRIYSIDVATTLAWIQAGGENAGKRPEAQEIGSTLYRVQQLAASPDGRWLAFISEPRSQREESVEPFGIHLINLAEAAKGDDDPTPALTNPQAFFDRIQWSDDSRKIFFSFLNGSVEGPYQDAQGRIYSMSIGQIPPAKCGSPANELTCERWGSEFTGSMSGFTALPGGGLLAAGMTGTEVQPYTQASAAAEFAKRQGWPGTYANLSAAKTSSRVAFVYSSLQRPVEVYLADEPSKMDQARAITSFNEGLTKYALPQGKPFRWTADDGTSVEGMLIYPPGRFGDKYLPMFTFIHGGPEDADGNHFEADWYQWADLAATDGWLVFEPNYRGSVGYGDKFALGIIPHIVSRPGNDILEGVDTLVKQGLADPTHLAIGGYSYGGYMTNWLITQTTRFRAAVTGAGAVEHVVNWGNDDTTFDDAYFLGGLPWETDGNYNAEAAIWQIGKVKTPTHIVAGADDIRVYVGEDYLLERALHAMGVPCDLLIFPGEGHGLANNPWHGKIKVREELKWLEKYGR